MRMRDISEYKLLGYYLLKLYEKDGVDSIKYEQAKQLTNNVFNKIGFSNYRLLPLDDKLAIVKSMISKGVFRTTSIGGKQSFTQVYNFEIAKMISTCYGFDGNLVFKIPKECKSSGNQVTLNYKKAYEADLNLDLLAAINKEFYSISSKNVSKNRS